MSDKGLQPKMPQKSEELRKEKPRKSGLQEYEKIELLSWPKKLRENSIEQSKSDGSSASPQQANVINLEINTAPQKMEQRPN